MLAALREDESIIQICGENTDWRRSPLQLCGDGKAAVTAVSLDAAGAEAVMWLL